MICFPGNSWGVDLYTGEGCIGCGAQEQFYACADIAIGHDEIHIGVPPENHPWYFENYNDINSEFYYWGLVGNETWNDSVSMTLSCKRWNYVLVILMAVIALRGSNT